MLALNRECIAEFIEEYKLHPCLWKIKSKEYSDRDLRNSAYEKLIEKLRPINPGANRNLVVNKINCLRTNFRKEFKKVSCSVRSGKGLEEIYRPKLWYYEQMLFLKDQETAREGQSNVSVEEESEGDSDERESILVRHFIIIKHAIYLLIFINKNRNYNAEFKMFISVTFNLIFLSSCFAMKLLLQH